MSIRTFSIHYFICECDGCGKTATVKESRYRNIYNAAQAVRSLGWAYGKDKKVLCNNCRKDNYKFIQHDSGEE